MSKYTDYTLSHKERYDKWALDYNKNLLEDREYAALDVITNLLFDLGEQEQIPFSAKKTPDVKIMDIGCGTGLVGEILFRKGFTHIDGVDLSHKMIEKAYDLGVYQTLVGWVDLKKPLPFFFKNQYDLLICCGVFSLDMVVPSSFNYMIEITKPGGIVILSTRTDWHTDYNFQEYYEDLEKKGHIKLIKVIMDAPYLVGEFSAHYWAFMVLDNNIDIS